MMTNDVRLITSFDRDRIKEAIAHRRKQTGIHEDILARLEKLISSARIVRPREMPSGIVTMNSRFAVKNLLFGTLETLTLVFPEKANGLYETISILSPAGLSLLGLAAGKTARWETQISFCRVQLMQVLYQPEMAGDFQH